ncbi:MAG: VacJ family lipoprotein [Alphaproteobacteria bacterium]|nr:VacJ family lipoprotein [Alphaproteobacteria bacterium]MBE8220718.1 VacJ family lipoprotein [Alphaproteobacteria bacterium]
MRVKQYIVMLGAVFILVGCGGAPPIANPDPRDPQERFNRKMFAVHQQIDRFAIRPLAKTYEIIPSSLRRTIRNFFYNVQSPVTFVNDVLQGEKARADTTLTRFLLNSTIGFGGIFDPATSLGHKYHREDFGQTLAVYGVPPLPYSFTPGIGPTPWRDFGGMLIDIAFNPVTYFGVGAVWTVSGLVIQAVDARANADTTLVQIEKTSIDFYASIRSLYYQNRESRIHNGKIDLDALPELDFEE